MRKARAFVVVGFLVAATMACGQSFPPGGNVVDVGATQVALTVSETLTAAAPTVPAAPPTPTVAPTYAPFRRACI